MAAARSRKVLHGVIKNNFECGICMKFYKDPKELPCKHAFCRKCLKKHIKFSVEEDRKYFNCPVCRGSTVPPDPEKPKQTWASQFGYDFRLRSLHEELQRYVAETTLDSEVVNDDRTRAAVTTASTSTVSTSEMSPKLTQQPPRHVSSATSQKSASTSHRDHAQRDLYHDITSGPIIHTADTSIVKHVGGDNSSQATSGSVERCIDLATGDRVYYDLTVLIQGEKKIILAPHFDGKSLQAIRLDSRLEGIRRYHLDLEGAPIRICHIDNTTVAVTTLNPNAIVLCNFQGEQLQVQKQILTKKAYDGIAFLEGGLFVVTTETDIDIIDRNGEVQYDYKVTIPTVLRPDNCYVSVTPGGEMIITDLSGHALTCLKRDGKLLWQKKKKIYKNPMGTAVDSSGAIFVADHTKEAIFQLNSRGSFVCNVVEKSVQFRKPSAIALDHMGYMYVICDNSVAVVKLSNCDS